MALISARGRFEDDEWEPARRQCWVKPKEETTSEARGGEAKEGLDAEANDMCSEGVVRIGARGRGRCWSWQPSSRLG